MDVDSACLAETVRAVEGLVFQRRDPPQVDQNDVIATCEIQAWYVLVSLPLACDFMELTGTAGFERDENDPCGLARLDFLQSFLSVWLGH